MNEEYLKLPRASEVEYLWSEDWYDGPLSGMCAYEGRKLWFQCVNEVDDSDGVSRRHFTLHALPAEQLEDVLKWHKLFREKVGTHFDKCENGCGVTQPEGLWNEFYGPYRARELKYSYWDNPAIAWTDDL
jgi:hypothetical protein